MTTIKLNNVEFPVEVYNKYTYFTNDGITNNANCTVRITDSTILDTLILVPITSIQIKYEGNVIYTLSNINARIENINEYLDGDHISTNIGLTFDEEEEEEPNT